jgi:D-alanine-D-alanine ligase
VRVAIVHSTVDASAAPDEQDVLVQAKAVCEALALFGHDPFFLPCSLDLSALRRAIEAQKPNVVFNLVESLAGKGQLIALVPFVLDALGIPYTGASAAAILLTSDKISAKEKMRAFGLDTPEWIGPYAEGTRPAASEKAGLPRPLRAAGPWIIKSVWEHASLGLSEDGLVHANSAADLTGILEQRAPFLGGACFAETYIDGREFNLSLLTGPDGPEVLPPAEIIFEGYAEDRPRIVDYRAKWDETSYEYHHTPRRFVFPDQDRDLISRLKATARQAWRVFRLNGYARVDFRVDQKGRPYILEINTNPCLSPDAGFAAALAEAGIPFEAAVERILADALPDRRAGAASLIKKKADASLLPKNASASISVKGEFRYAPIPQDVFDIRRIITATGFFRPDEIDVAVELVEDRISKEEKSDYRFIFYQDPERLLGYCCYGRIACTTQSWDLYWIAVDPEFQGRGIGRVILAQAEARIRDQKGAKIYIDTSQSERYAPTRSFYEKAGYRPVAVLEDFYAPGDAKLIYCKTLF